MARRSPMRVERDGTTIMLVQDHGGGHLDRYSLTKRELLILTEDCNAALAGLVRNEQLKST